jgi:hypothetical protein
MLPTIIRSRIHRALNKDAHRMEPRCREPGTSTCEQSANVRERLWPCFPLPGAWGSSFFHRSRSDNRQRSSPGWGGAATRSYDPIRLPSMPPPESDVEAAILADSCTTAKNHGYSITSSAIARSCGGILRPSALAVLLLMTNSTLVDCVTGRSRGVSPSRMRAAQTPTRR